MNGQNLNKQSKTDWARIDAMTDDDIDTSDIAELDEEFFASAELRMPKNKTSVMLSVDSEVLEWFEDQGAEFQYRIKCGAQDIRGRSSAVSQLRITNERNS